MRKTTAIIIIVIAISSFPSLALAVEPAASITDREIVERFTKVETKLDSVEKGVQQLREDINLLREDMKEQNRQLREDMNTQFNRLAAIFTALVVAIIGFAIWDRRTMIRPFETKVKEIEEKISGNHAKLHSLLEALRSLSKSDTKVAEVLRSFNLL